MSNVTTKECGFCGSEFEAKRSDARFCGATCRKRHHRAELHPFVSRSDQALRGMAPRARTKDGTRIHTKTQRLQGVLDSMTGPLSAGMTESWREVLHSFDSAGALADPEFPLDEWDRKLTETIQFMIQVRRAIRDERERHD